MKPHNKDDTFEVLKSRVISWADERGILHGSTPAKQALKTIEEANELHKAVKIEDYRDALGDVLVTLIIGAEIANVDILECLAEVLDVIEKMKGKLINGIFVKDKD
jgi:NTP pyrophosphatase (non-canonical NTP hydrolase)